MNDSEAKLAQLLDEVERLKKRVTDLEKQVREIPEVVSRKLGEDAQRAVSDMGIE